MDNIYIEDIVMMNIPTEPLLFDLHYGGKSAVEAAAEGASPFEVEYVPADVTTPQFKDIYIKDVKCSGAARAMYFNGIPEKNIENIVVEDCEIVAMKGADLRYSTGVVLKDVKITMYVAFLSYLVINLPLGYVMAFVVGLGAPGVWIGFIGGLSVAAILFRIRYLKDFKRIVISQ